MTRSYWLTGLIASMLLSACSSGPRRPAPDTPPPVAAPAVVPVDLEQVDEASAGVEEAGIEDGLEEEAPRRVVDEAAGPRTPAAFLHPEERELPEAIQRQVEQFVHAFTEGRARETYRRWLEREAVWGDWIRAELRAADLPEDLVYLAMIESGFHPTAVSHAGATGMWQFMPATGRMSGLRVDSWVDERRDPEAATRAAIGHLSELHAATGDWALSAAAYNAGSGRVSRAQAGQPRTDYFSLSLEKRLPRETRDYVPIILAAAWVDVHRSQFGLPPREPSARPAIDTLAVEGRVRLSVLAEGLGLSTERLKSLNPHLVRGAVPPSGGLLWVPAATDTAGLGRYLASLPRDERLLPDWTETYYAVRSGDSWWAIARRHDTTVDRLRALNPKRGAVIHPGDRLVVRRVAAYDTPGRTIAAASPSSRSPGGTAEYTVRAGDTMSGVASRIGVPLAALVEWNEMAAPRPLRIGETLRVSPP